MINKLLAHQVQKHLGDTANLPEAFVTFIESISVSYDRYDDKIKSLESSVEGCISELSALNEKLLNETAGLKNANDELSRIFNQVNEGFFSKNISTDRYIQMSVGCEKIYGYSITDFYANSLLWLQVIHPDDRVLIEKEQEQLIKGMQTKSAYRIIHKDSTTRWVEVKAVPVIEEGRLTRVEGVVNDITERKNAEILLKDSELKYRSFFENAMDGILLSKPNSVILEANPAACEIFRLTEKEICGYSNSELIALGGSGLVNLQEVRSRTGKFRGEINFVRPDGTKLVVELASGLFKGANGEDRSFIIVKDITDRKKAEAAMVMNERQLNLIYNTVNDSIFMLTIEEGNRFKFVSVNHTFLKTTGKEKEQMIGKYVEEVIPSPLLELALEKYQEAITCKKTISWEEQTDFPSGIKTGIASITPILDDSGNCIMIIGSVHDISERKKAEEEIKRSDQNFQSLVNTVDGIVWEADAATFQFSFVSKRAEVLLGYPLSAWIESPGFWKDHIHPEDRDSTVSYCIQCTSEKRSHEFEYRMIAADGKIVWLQDFVSVIINEDLTCYLRGIMVDITARKQAEAKLHKSEERYRQIVETTQEGIWMIDENNNTTFVNKKMCEIIEYLPAEIVGKSIHCFMNEKSNTIIAQQIKRRKQGINETFYFKFIAKSGSVVWTSLSTNPVFDDAGIYKGTLAMVTDITKRKHNEELLQKSEANLDLKNKELERKNKELEQFAYVASHDLQEPLRTASGFVQLLQQQYQGKLDEMADKYLRFIVESSDRMKILINDLLDYSRIGSKLETKQVDCSKVMKDVIADLDKAITDSSAIIIAGDLPVISGYPTEIKQLFQNLIINAIKFRKPDTVPQIKILANKTSGHWHFSFADNGIGIDKKHNERIFIIFQRLHTRSEYQGSGIGLSHCKKIVELHHGRIWVDSGPGEGSVFHFTIREKDGL